MSKPIGNLFKENYPHSSSITGIPLFGLMLLAINLSKLSNIKIADLLLTVATYAGLFFVGLFVSIAVLETFAKFFPTLKKLVLLLMLIPQVLLKLYTLIVKTLIKNSVVLILEEKGNIVSERLVLRNRGADKADDFWGKTIDFSEIKSLELAITPSSGTDYWRLGLKFSQTESFTTARYGPNFPLFHLTKDNADNNLKFNYYNEQGQAAENRESILVRGYQKEKIFLTAVVKKGLKSIVNIEVKDENKKKVYEREFPLNSHKYAQLFAWGDGKDYELEVRNYIQG